MKLCVHGRTDLLHDKNGTWTAKIKSSSLSSMNGPLESVHLEDEVCWRAIKKQTLQPGQHGSHFNTPHLWNRGNDIVFLVHVTYLKTDPTFLGLNLLGTSFGYGLSGFFYRYDRHIQTVYTCMHVSKSDCVLMPPECWRLCRTFQGSLLFTNLSSRSVTNCVRIDCRNQN